MCSDRQPSQLCSLPRVEAAMQGGRAAGGRKLCFAQFPDLPIGRCSLPPPLPLLPNPSGRFSLSLCGVELHRDGGNGGVEGCVERFPQSDRPSLGGREDTPDSCQPENRTAHSFRPHLATLQVATHFRLHQKPQSNSSRQERNDLFSYRPS